MSRPFLLLSSRPEDDVADLEHRSVARLMGLRAADLVQVRMEARAMPALDLRAFSGVLLGGSPYTFSDDDKSAVQLRVEAEAGALLQEVLEREVPFLGLCYGIGLVTDLLGGTVDRTFLEPVGAITIRLTDAGRADPLLEGTPTTFEAYVGHKDCCPVVPPGAVLLATSEPCPVQMYRVGVHAYVTQYHPELDHAGLAARIRAYPHHGYFPAHEAEALIEATGTADVSAAHFLLRRFAERYA